MEAVFAKMVAKKVEDRYQTMTEVIADLERVIAGQAAPQQSRPARRGHGHGPDEVLPGAAVTGHEEGESHCD